MEIFNCFFTRHHNGYLREQSLRKIINIDKPFVVPFVLQLAGEYVYEILEVIHDHLNHLDLNNYLNYINQNQKYYKKTRDRMISYWDCKYRRDRKELRNYKGLKIFKYFESHIK
jgi:hypothetical protein